MRFAKIYLEITNLCNLACSFCPGTSRPPQYMSADEFEYLMPVLRPYSDYLYFHLMGEPLFHPNLAEFLQIAGRFGFRVVLTSNGTLLPEHRNDLLSAKSLHKINLSLHSFEANSAGIDFSEYLSACIELGRIGPPERSFIICYRLWNEGGLNHLNQKIETALREAFPWEWIQERGGTRLGDRVYLQYGEKFDWPEESAEDGGERGFCYGLRDQIGVLVDGTVVPCCLDNDGKMALGNLFSQSLEEILSSTRARAIYDGFSSRIAVEPLCRRCGFARRFR